MTQSAVGSDWHFQVGAVATRSEIHGRYGGAIYGGIEPSTTTPNLMIYTDPKQGALNGYDYDGWDRNDPNVFYYTGAGRRGDQKMSNRNLAVLNHARDRRAIRLFEAVDEPQTVGGKRQAYVGAFYLDPAHPFRMAPAPDADGNQRQVIVFRLIREGVAALQVSPAPPGEETVAAPATLAARALQSQSEVEVTLVPSEEVTVVEVDVAPSVGHTARREEAELVAMFEKSLRAKGRDVQRARIRIPGELHELVTATLRPACCTKRSRRAIEQRFGWRSVSSSTISGSCLECRAESCCPTNLRVTCRS
jgi:hypothetical protein